MARKRLNGPVTVSIVLDAETRREADSIRNFSGWVRSALRRRAAIGDEQPMTVQDAPVNQLAAALFGRLEDDDPLKQPLLDFLQLGDARPRVPKRD